MTETALVFYSVGLFAWAGQAILARGFFAMQDTVTPIILGTVATIIFIPMSYVRMVAMGHGGLALATSIAATLHMLALAWFLRKRLGGIEGGKVLSGLGKVVAASVAMGAACYAVRFAMAGIVDVHARSGAALTVLVAAMASMIVYLGLVKIMRLEEATYVWNVARARLSRANKSPEEPVVDTDTSFPD
jgi:putative peptidoglycan lipid II flippase